MTALIILANGSPMNQAFTWGVALTVIGVFLALVAMVFIAIGGKGNRDTKAGGIIMIGPIPIIFGTDRGSVKILIVLAIVLMLLVSGLTILPYLR